MNPYSDLAALLQPQPQPPAGLVGTVLSVSPLRVEAGGAALERELLRPLGMTFTREDVGRAVALLPCGGDMLILTRLEAGI